MVAPQGGVNAPLMGLPSVAQLGILLLFGTVVGCGEFGLPTGRGEGNIERGDPTILYMEPNLASQGTEGLIVRVYALDTFLDGSTVVELPNQPEINISGVSALGFETLEFTMAVPVSTPLGSSPLLVSTERDGTLVFADGFTVVP